MGRRVNKLFVGVVRSENEVVTTHSFPETKAVKAIVQCGPYSRLVTPGSISSITGEYLEAQSAIIIKDLRCAIGVKRYYPGRFNMLIVRLGIGGDYKLHKNEGTGGGPKYDNVVPFHV